MHSSLQKPMVISINIGYYQNKPKNPGIKGVSCKDLDGIHHDYHHMKKLCNALNYELFPKEEKYFWTQQEIVEFLEECADELSQNICGKQSVYKYDSLFVVVSSHGYNNGII